ncbi:nuclear transport factor 2 family protein [Nocardioides sp.]|uniref:nuclear transport factor 2 family protein n=1 Tax=Nocardioides sp. TaxID=35761 RepID=UPI00271FAF13|nr:nuclear transport factor 2 family protein [Nocardioides sp.]MDO9457525.1 nuclear transport factor 2 family protein [Nocardioides sp.]
MTTTETRKIAETYFAAWQDRDAETLRSILADDATFRGPLGTADDADACVAGLIGMAQVLDRIEVRARVVEGDDVITFFDLHTTVAPPAPTANWTHVEDGRITAIRVAFDPREILAAGDAG